MVVLLLSVLLAAEGAAGDSDLIRPCKKDSPAHRSATALLHKLDKRIRALKPAEDMTAVLAMLHEFDESPCFEIADDILPYDNPDSALALTEFWKAGGHGVYKEYLALDGNDNPIIAFAPSVRKTLTLQTRPNSPLRPLLCPAVFQSCGVDTEPWILRAEMIFEMRRQLNSLSQRMRRCDIEAGKQPVGKAFVDWRDCREMQLSSRRPAFPIGRLQAPKQGWLIIHRRNEVSVYGMKAGAAFRLRDKVEMGFVPVSAIREAAWMLLLVDEVQENVERNWYGTGAKGIEIARDRKYSGGVQWGIGWDSSAHINTLDWQFVVEGRSLKHGTLRWLHGMLSPAHELHAITLLQVAEAQQKIGCPSAHPPVVLHGFKWRTPKRLQRTWRKLVEGKLDCPNAPPP